MSHPGFTVRHVQPGDHIVADIVSEVLDSIEIADVLADFNDNGIGE